jgi:hypothetical protein
LTVALALAVPRRWPLTVALSLVLAALSLAALSLSALSLAALALILALSQAALALILALSLTVLPLLRAPTFLGVVAVLGWWSYGGLARLGAVLTFRATLSVGS